MTISNIRPRFMSDVVALWKETGIGVKKTIEATEPTDVTKRAVRITAVVERIAGAALLILGTCLFVSGIVSGNPLAIGLGVASLLLGHDFIRLGDNTSRKNTAGEDFIEVEVKDPGKFNSAKFINRVFRDGELYKLTLIFGFFLEFRNAWNKK